LYFNSHYIVWEKKSREEGGGVRVERKIFHSLEMVQPARKQRDEPSWSYHGLPGLREETGRQRVHLAEGAQQVPGDCFSSPRYDLVGHFTMCSQY
jgi:hypothetical protein